jgi:hypothetical protein
MKREVGIMSVGLVLLLTPCGAAAFPVYTGGGFSQNIFDIDCSSMQRWQQLSRHPLDYKHRTTHADRQHMIQLKMFKCVPEGMHEIDRLLEDNKPTLGATSYALGRERLFKTSRQREDGVRENRESVEDFIDYQALFGEDAVDSEGKLIRKLSREEKQVLRAERMRIQDLLRGRTTDDDPGDTDDIPRAIHIRGLDAHFAATFGTVKYLGQLSLTLFEGGKDRYNPADNSYPWIWPKHAIVALEEAADAAFGGVRHLGPVYGTAGDPLDLSVVKMLTPKKSTDGQGLGSAPDDEEIKDQAVFFAEPIEPVLGNPSNPNHRAENFASYQTNFELFKQVSNTDVETARLRLIVIARLLTEIRYLRQEFALALVCKFKTGSECPDRRPLAVIAKATKDTLVPRQLLSFPMMAPFTVKVHASQRDKVCENMQRADRAHAGWARAVRQGHKPSEFRNAWTSMFAHSVILANQALPWPLDFNRDGAAQAQKFVSVILAKNARQYPGFVDGECKLGPVELDPADYDLEDERDFESDSPAA